MLSNRCLPVTELDNFPMFLGLGNVEPLMYRMEHDGMSAAVEKLQNVVIVTIGERMDIFNAPMLMKQLNQLVDGGATHFIVDLSAVHVVDADGDYPLLHLLKCAQEVGGSVSLVCPMGNPIRVFYEMMRLDTLFEMYETLDEALVYAELLPEAVA